jgi:uncharacterized delta-60 repeat protein
VLTGGNVDGDFLLSRYLPDGTLDTSFGVNGRAKADFGGDDVVRGLTIQADGKILLVGYSMQASPGTSDVALARFDTQGRLDPAFSGDGMLRLDRGADEFGESLVQEADGSLLLLTNRRPEPNPSFYQVNVQRLSGSGELLKYGAVGFASIDYLAAVGFGTFGSELLARADGLLYLIGERQDADGIAEIMIQRFGADGSAYYPIFSNLDADNTPAAAIFQDDGKLLILGQANGRLLVLRYDKAGNPDASFGAGNGIVQLAFSSDGDNFTSIQLQADGKIILAGSINKFSTVTTNNIALVRLHANGALDTSFGTGGLVTTDINPRDRGTMVALQADGKMLLSGASGPSADAETILIRYNTDGSIDTGFGSHSSLSDRPLYRENSAPVVLDHAVSIVDPDLAEAGYTGATLTLKRTEGRHPDDLFGASGNLGSLVTGGALTLSGVTIGIVAENAGGQLVLQLTGNASQARLDEMLRSITYANASEAPPATVSIGWTFSDGNTGKQGSGGALSLSGRTVVGITAVNDMPEGHDGVVGVAGAYVFRAADFGFSDPEDGATLGAVRIDKLPAAGSLRLDGVAVTLKQVITGADLNAGKLSYSAASASDAANYAQLEFSVRDSFLFLDSTPNKLVFDVGHASLTGGAGNDVLFGSAQGESMTGAGGNDSLRGYEGNDRLTGGAGDDVLDGGSGLDTAVYPGKRASFSIGKDGASATVTDQSGAEGSDKLVSVERLQFADVSVALDGDSVAGQAYRIYQAAFNRVPDAGGLGYWMSRMEHGASLQGIATEFAGSAEFKTLYGEHASNADIVSRFYTNVLHRQPETAGYNYWLGILDQQQQSVAQVLAQFSESPENVAALVGVISAGVDFIPYP